MNSVQLTGHLTAEPQLLDKGKQDIVHFTVAVQRNYKNREGDYDADFIRCTAFAKRADMIADHFNKGSYIEVTGSWQTGSYEDKSGNRVYTNECVVNNVGFGGGSKKNSNNIDSKKQSNHNANLDSLMQSEPPADDNNLPF